MKRLKIEVYELVKALTGECGACLRLHHKSSPHTSSDGRTFTQTRGVYFCLMQIF